MEENEVGKEPPVRHVERGEDGKPVWTFTNAEGKVVTRKGGSFMRPPHPIDDEVWDILEGKESSDKTIDLQKENNQK